MLLMLERFPPDFSRKSDLELAMLLDTSPYYDYCPHKSGEPWRADSPLTKATRTADLAGYAWLTVVFLSDKPSTWGSKQVILSSDGKIRRPDVTPAGVRTGHLCKLRYEVVARHIFHNIEGHDTQEPYTVLTEARLVPRNTPHDVSKMQLDTNPSAKDPLFGYLDRESPNNDGRSHPPSHPPFADPHMDCLCFYENHLRNAGKLFFKSETKATGPDFHNLRFLLTEYQRRPFVRVVLQTLGFVKGPNVPSQQTAIGAHLHTIGEAFSALYEIDASGRFTDPSHQYDQT